MKVSEDGFPLQASRHEPQLLLPERSAAPGTRERLHADARQGGAIEIRPAWVR